MSATLWSKFYWSDWRSDPALRVCSLAARGLWIEMLAIMNEAKPVGSLVVNGKPLSVDQLASLVGRSGEETGQALAELDAAGVFSRKRNGIIFSRRIERDEIKSRKNRENGKKGGNPSLGNNKTKEQSVNPEDNPELKTQIPDTTYQKPDSSSGSVAREPLNWDDLEAKLREAAGWQRESHPGLKVVGPIVALIENCADLERDVLPTVRAIASQATTRTSWKYFLPAIKRAMDDRLNAAKLANAPPETRRHAASNPPRRTAFDLIAEAAAITDPARHVGAFDAGDSDETHPPAAAQTG